MNMTDILQRIADRISEIKSTERAVSIAATNSPDTIRNWRRKLAEGDDAGATLNKLVAVAKALKLTPDYLIGGGDKPAVPSGFQEPNVTPWLRPSASDPVTAAIAAIESDLKKPMTYQINHPITAFSLCAGDLIVLETMPPFSDGLVVATVSDPMTAAAETVMRRKYGDHLLNPSISEDLPIITISDDQAVAVIGTVKAVIRAT